MTDPELIAKKLALIACCRKLLVVLNAIVASEKTWRIPLESGPPASAG